MQISSLREYYGFGLRSHLAVLDARTTNAVPALYVPEKLNRGERQITRPRRITPRTARCAAGSMKKPLRRGSERSGHIFSETRSAVRAAPQRRRHRVIV